jgi:hypothetical protein
MGILVIIGMMSYAAGLCWLFQRIDRRSTRVPDPEIRPDGAPVDVVVPDRVPRAWVEAFRSEQGG